MLKTHTGINDILEQLKACQTEEDVQRLVPSLDMGIEDMAPYIFWREDTYARNCIFRNALCELILLCWEEGQATPVHNHGGQECWVKVLDGEVGEIRYRDEENIPVAFSEEILKAGHTCYMEDEMGYHKLYNHRKGRSMTLHLYARPIHSCSIYNEKSATFEQKRSQDYSYEGKLLATGI